MKTRESLTGLLWHTFTSVRLTIALILILILFSVAGSLIAQQATAQAPLEKIYSPETLKWLKTFGLTDLFHSGVFVFSMFLLALNLIACSFERLPRIWRQAFHVPAPPVEDPVLDGWTKEKAKKRKYLLERPGRGKFETTREAKMAALLFFQKKFGGYAVLRDREDEFQITVEKGKYSRLGVYVTHLSLLMIMAGGVMGAVWGFEGGMSIEEGTRQSFIQHTKGSTRGMNAFRERGVPVQGFLELGFEVECQDFTLETYDGQRPKAFRSRLNFYENDVKVHSTEIAVNHPAVYRGLTFYQASYQELGVGEINLKIYREKPGQPIPAPSARKGGIELTAVPPESVELIENVRPGELYRIDGKAGFRITQVEPDVMGLGPAAKLQYFATRDAKKPQKEFWVFQRLPGFDFAHRRGAPHHFVVDQIHPKFATGLSVASDPGVWVVWIGSIVLITALFMALYTFHSRYWVAWTKRDGFVVAGWSNKLFIFEPRFEKYWGEFRKEIQ